MTQTVEHLLTKHEALPQYCQKEKRMM
jgi:hypothetical protein